jgi:hypothetical protein
LVYLWIVGIDQGPGKNLLEWPEGDCTIVLLWEAADRRKAVSLAIDRPDVQIQI